MKKPLLLGLLFLVGLLFPSFLRAQVIKVAVLPFEINAREDLSYVREGIQDMLSTRLFVPGKVVVIDEAEVKKALAEIKGPLTENLARKIGQKLGADYVVFGSLTTFGQKASIDAKLIPVKEDKPPLALYAYTNTLDDLIPKLADFAKQGVAYIEGKPRQMASLVPGAAYPSAKPRGTLNHAPAAPPPEDFLKMHPERIFRTQGPPPAPASVQAHQAQPQKQEVRASKYKYSDIDPWPDYPPDEEDLAPLVIESNHKKPNHKKKKHFWSKLWPGNWFGKKEEGEIITPSGSVPPPPPPPGYQAQAPQTPQPQGYGATPPPPPPPPVYQGAQNQPSGGKTWEWY